MIRVTQDLPPEVLLMIFRLLPPRHLATCREVCLRWNYEIKNRMGLMRKIWSGITFKSCKEEAENGNIDFIKALVEYSAGLATNSFFSVSFF